MSEGVEEAGLGFRTGVLGCKFSGGALGWSSRVEFSGGVLG